VKEEAIKQEKGKEVADSSEEVDVKIDEGEIFTLSTRHAQKNHEYLSLFLTCTE